MPTNRDKQTPTDLALGSFIAAIKSEIYPEIRAFVQAEFRAGQFVTPSPPTKRLYSLRDLALRYKVGRSQASADIAAGRLRVVERRCRGGRMGKFIPIEEAERLYAGVLR